MGSTRVFKKQAHNGEDRGVPEGVNWGVGGEEVSSKHNQFQLDHFSNMLFSSELPGYLSTDFGAPAPAGLPSGQTTTRCVCVCVCVCVFVCGTWALFCQITIVQELCHEFLGDPSRRQQRPRNPLNQAYQSAPLFVPVPPRKNSVLETPAERWWGIRSPQMKKSFSNLKIPYVL